MQISQSPAKTGMLLMLSAMLALGAGCATHVAVKSDAPIVIPKVLPTRLNDSTRHQEWIDVKQGNRTVRCFVVYPETKEKVPAVLLIHENMGLTDWARGMADQVAEEGYIGVAPDLLSGMGPNGGKTSDFASVDAARQ